MAAIQFDAALAGSQAASEEGVLSKFVGMIVAFQARRQTKQQLEALSDDMLRDIGITRGEINEVVRGL